LHTDPVISSPNVELELFEAAVVHAAPRAATHTAIALILDQSLHARPTETTYAVRTGIAFFEIIETPAACTVDLHRLSWGEHW
jgi:archaellum component FlaG (FlaF/FlaG flagellin family)